MKRLVFALLILFCGNDMSAQTYTKEVCVRFPVASSVLNPNFGDNAASLAEIVKFLTDVQKDSTLELTSVKFCGSASPEGGPLLNQASPKDAAPTWSATFASECSCPMQ